MRVFNQKEKIPYNSLFALELRLALVILLCSSGVKYGFTYKR